MNLKHLLTTITLYSFASYASSLDVNLGDPSWNGFKIPVGQQCQKFGGVDPATPKWVVTDIPAGSDWILFEYSDRDSKKMNNGGHGRMAYALETLSTNVYVPSVAGHTFSLPPKFTMVEAHRGSGWDIDGAYMPPCSGGKDHAYYVTIKTLKNNQVTAETVVEMGNY